MFARQVLHQIQKEHEEKAQLLKEERVKEYARLSEEQKALELKTRLQQEALQREQELLRQKEAERKRKELERLEEMAKQQELERIRGERERQRQEELERRRVAELRAKEEKRREEEAAARQHEERRQKIEQQRLLESGHQQENQLRAGSARRPADGSNRPKKVRNRQQRPRVNQYNPELHQPPSFREPTTTPSPNQPPLSVYMGSSTSRLDPVRVTDVLRILRDAKTIAVLDNVGPDAPQVFVGPSNLDPPHGYAKFDLPYLSSLDHNRVERKVDKLPFFVAPLSFDPPPGYAKIPFPAPHVGSVVVNTLAESSSPEPTVLANPSPTPLIEPNSYSDADHSGSIAATTASYDSPSTTSSTNFSPEQQQIHQQPGNPKYESAYPAKPSPTGSGSGRFRFRQFYDNKPTSLISTSYYGEHATAKKQYEQSPKHTSGYRQEVSYSSTPSFQEKTVSSSSSFSSPHDPSTKTQDLAAQLALINQELAHQRSEGHQGYNVGEQSSQVNLGSESYDVNDVRAPVGPTQYNLPAELPPISPHLPGLVNSLVDKQEAENRPDSSTSPRTTTTTTTTTAAPTTTITTTARVSSTTYKPRGR